MMSAEELLGLPVEKLIRLKTSQLGLASQEEENCLQKYGYDELAKISSICSRKYRS
jgi:N6-adenosine-specific RNA methylase IME4